MEIQHEEHHKKGEFYAEEDGRRIARLQYLSSADGRMTIYHTEVDPKLRGKHFGEKLVKAAVTMAREKGLKIDPTCPYAAKVIDRTPEYKDVLA
jgi:predicted GNAT family acetyltransferase